MARSFFGTLGSAGSVFDDEEDDQQGGAPPPPDPLSSFRSLFDSPAPQQPVTPATWYDWPDGTRRAYKPPVSSREDVTAAIQEAQEQADPLSSFRSLFDLEAPPSSPVFSPAPPTSPGVKAQPELTAWSKADSIGPEGGPPPPAPPRPKPAFMPGNPLQPGDPGQHLTPQTIADQRQPGLSIEDFSASPAFQEFQTRTDAFKKERERILGLHATGEKDALALRQEETAIKDQRTAFDASVASWEERGKPQEELPALYAAQKDLNGKIDKLTQRWTILQSRLPGQKEIDALNAEAATLGEMAKHVKAPHTLKVNANIDDITNEMEAFQARPPASRPARTQPPAPRDDYAGAPPDILGAAHRWVVDPLISGLKGAIAIPEAAIGVGDLAARAADYGLFGGQARATAGIPSLGEMAQHVGFDPAAARRILDTYYSEQQQQANKRVARAEGPVDIAIAALSNPSVIAHNVIESLPLMFAGGAVGRGALMAGSSEALAGGIGEGIAQAGSATEQSRQELGRDLSTGEMALTGGSGVFTGIIGHYGGKLAERLGIADVDTMLAGAARSKVAGQGLYQAIISTAKGAVVEGLFEELPQSFQEQVMQNLAEGKPWHEGVAQNAILGAFAGAVMGGGANAFEAAAEPLQRRGLKPEEIARLAREGMTDADAAMLRQRGLSDKQIATFRAAVADVEGLDLPLSPGAPPSVQPVPPVRPGDTGAAGIGAPPSPIGQPPAPPSGAPGDLAGEAVIAPPPSTGPSPLDQYRDLFGEETGLRAPGTGVLPVGLQDRLRELGYSQDDITAMPHERALAVVQENERRGPHRLSEELEQDYQKYVALSEAKGQSPVNREVYRRSIEERETERAKAARAEHEQKVAAGDVLAPLAETFGVAPPPVAPPHKYSSTQLNLPAEDAAHITALATSIPDADLAGDGRAVDPHITVKYGLHTENADDVRKVLAKQKPIEVTLGKTSLFEPSESSDGAAVVKVDVDSPELHALNKKISDALEHTTSFPDYKPHVTIAYVKPSVADKYKGLDALQGRKITLSELTFSGKNGETVTIPLGGQEAPAAAGTSEQPQAPARKRLEDMSEEELAALSDQDVARMMLEEEQGIEGAAATPSNRPLGTEGAPPSEGGVPSTPSPLERIETLKPVENKHGERRAVPFERADDDEALRIYKARDVKTAALVDIPLDKIVATQGEVQPAIVRDYVKTQPARATELTPEQQTGAGPGALPMAVEYEGRFYLTDGTHKATAAWARGDKTIQGVVYQADAEKVKAPQPPASKPAVSQPTEKSEGKTEKSEGKKPEAPTASVPFMITKAMEAQLRDRGYSHEDINKMTPAQAQAVLAEPEERVETPAEKPDPTKLFGVMKGAEDRWAKRRETGLSDEDLKKAIGQEFGIGGGRSDGGVEFTYSGGREPSIVITTPKDMAGTYKGRRLLDLARRVLEIGKPADKARGDAIAAAKPFEYDVEGWRDEQKEMGSSAAEIANAIYEATKIGVDPTRSDDIEDLATYIAAVENDADFRKGETKIGNVGDADLMAWFKANADELARIGERPRSTYKEGTVEGETLQRADGKFVTRLYINDKLAREEVFKTEAEADKDIRTEFPKMVKRQQEAAAPPSKPAVAENTPKIIHNTGLGSVEVRFPQKPSPEVIASLKAAGFKWSKGDKAWYHKITGDNGSAKGRQQYLRDHDRLMALAKSIVGEKPAPPASKPAEPTAPAPVADKLAQGPIEVKPPLPRGQQPDWTEIGKNSIGQTLYQDTRGVRSYIENGVRHVEPSYTEMTAKRGQPVAEKHLVDRSSEAQSMVWNTAEVHDARFPKPAPPKSRPAVSQPLKPATEVTTPDGTTLVVQPLAPEGGKTNRQTWRESFKTWSDAALARRLAEMESREEPSGTTEQDARLRAAWQDQLGALRDEIASRSPASKPVTVATQKYYRINTVTGKATAVGPGTTPGARDVILLWQESGDHRVLSQGSKVSNSGLRNIARGDWSLPDADKAWRDSEPIEAFEYQLRLKAQQDPKPFTVDEWATTAIALAEGIQEHPDYLDYVPLDTLRELADEIPDVLAEPYDAGLEREDGTLKPEFEQVRALEPILDKVIRRREGQQSLFGAPEPLPADTSDLSPDKYHATQRGVAWEDMTDAEVRELFDEGTGPEQARAAQEMARRKAAAPSARDQKLGDLGRRLDRTGTASNEGKTAKIVQDAPGAPFKLEVTMDGRRYTPEETYPTHAAAATAALDYLLPETPGDQGMRTEGAIEQPSRYDEIEAEKARLKADNDARIARIKDKLKNQATTGIDPEILADMIGILRNYVKMGVLDFEAATMRFAEDYGAPFLTQVTPYWEKGWKVFRKEDRKVSDVLLPETEPEQTEGEVPANEERPVAGGEEGASQPQRPGGRRSSKPSSRPGEGPGTAEGPESGPGSGDRQPGTVRQQQQHDPALGARFYRITPEDRIGTGTVRERVANNLTAIRIIKALAAEQRLATPDEQKALVKYVGWGGLARIFEPWKFEGGDYAASQKDSEFWQAQHETLTDLLTDEEYRRARNSTQNAHYTSAMVIQGVWEAIQQLGVSRGAILEPSAGIGHFVGLAPDEIRDKLQWALVEMDPITAAIAAALYPGAYVQAAGFQDATLPDGHFTAAVSNIPFGKIPITDKAFAGPAFMKGRVHNYFFGKALDRVAPGGLVAFITTQGSLDSRDNQKVREYLAARADFLGAIRLPYTAFKGNAGTEVVTDIVFMRKRFEGQEPAHVAPWIESKSMMLPNRQGEPVEKFVNEYFHAHPEMVLGTHTATGKMRGADMYSVVPPGAKESEQLAHWEANGAQQIRDAVARLPQGVISLKPPKTTLQDFQDTRPPLGSRPFEYLEHEGKLAQVIDGKVTPIDISKADEARIRGLLPIRKALRDVYDVTADPDADEATLKAAQKVLNDAYDKFVKKHGFISSEENWRAFREDPDLPLLLSLEDFNPETEKATKTAVFTTRMMETVRRERRAQTADHAVQLSLGETGGIDLGRIAELLGTSEEDAANAIKAEGLALETPEGWQLPSKLKSGNVRQKLLAMEAAAKIDPRFVAAAEALRTAIPEDLPAHLIQVRLGASWITPEIVSEFVSSITGARTLSWNITYNPFDARWHIEGSPGAHASRFATPDADTKTILGAALNDKRLVIKVYDRDLKRSRVDDEKTALARQKVKEIQAAFTEWLFNEDPTRRTWAVRAYNDRFNAYRVPESDGRYLAFPGMSSYWRDKIAAHQRNAVARVLEFGNTLLAHVVGAGKTLEMVAAGMELRRLGLARKPLYVVPNHLIAQWPSEFLQYYPNARVLVARPEDFTAENRMRFTARIASGDWDAVIMPYSQFVRVSMSAEAESAYHRQILDEIEQAIMEAEAEDAAQQGVGGRSQNQRRKSPQVKQLENMRDRIQVKLDKIADRPKDDMLTFEQLGVDALLVDEAHSFKNLYFPTRQGNVAGIPSDSDAQRATDLYLKTRYINKLSNYRNVVLATGTPVSNSMAEIFVMQKLLQENVLESADINTFDAWLAQFGEIKVKTELDPSGTGLAPRARLSDFRNLPDLATMFRQVADVKMIDDLPDLKKARPPLEGDGPEVVEVKASPRQLAFLEALAHRADHLDPRDRRSDNMAKITVDGRLSSLDMRLIDRRLEDEPGTKLHVIADRVADLWKQYDSVQGTQLVFMDSGTPGAEERAARPRKVIDPATGAKTSRPPTEAEFHRGLDLYEDLKKKLISRGIPEKQIAFIHDVDKVPAKKRDAALKALFNKMKRGEIRVLIGSSSRMGTGMNVQDRLVGLHNADPTYKPSETEQRYGRILRQGNLLAKADPSFKVRIMNYVTTGEGLKFGFDAYMWQLNEAKAKFIADFFKGNITQRSAGLDLDQTVLTAGQMKAVATGNPLIIKQAELEAEVERLVLVRRGWEEARREAQWGINDYERRVQKHEQVVATQMRTKDAVTPHEEGATYVGDINGEHYEGHEAIGKAILKELEKHTQPSGKETEAPRWPPYKRLVFLGTYRGLSLYATGDNGIPHVMAVHPQRDPQSSRGADQYWTIQTPAQTVRNNGDSEWRNPSAILRSIETSIDNLGEGESRFSAGWYEENKRTLAQYQAMVGGQFEQQGELDKAIADLEAVERELGVTRADNQEEEVNTGGEDEGEGGGSSGDASIGEYAENGVAAQWMRDGRDRVVASSDIEDNPLADAPAVPKGTEGRIVDAADGLLYVDFGEKYNTVPVEEREVQFAAPRVPGATRSATSGNFAQPQPAAPSTLKGFQLPEMVELARTLLGAPPKVVKGFRSAARGMFISMEGTRQAGIALAADLFKPGNEHQLAATLTHEIGHLDDWLPDYTLKRGNILGHLRSLKRFLKGKYTATDGSTVTNKQVRAELIALSKMWRPWDRDTATATQRAYRDSAKELYADAISVLMNDPGLLEREAPIFFKEFFAELDRKPEVKSAYFNMQAVLGGTPEEITARRIAGDYAMFDDANTKAIDLERKRQQESREARRDIWQGLRVQVLDKHLPFIDRVKALERQGVTINPDDDIRYALSERGYLPGKIKAFVESRIQPIFAALGDVGVDWDTFALALLYQRVMGGEKYDAVAKGLDRVNLANPRGITPADAERRYLMLLGRMTPEQRAATRKAVTDFRSATRRVASDAYKAGLYSDEMYQQMRDNPTYATFRVVDHLEEHVTSRVYKQIGTLKDVQNVADATILKMIATIRATEHNNVKRKAFVFLHQFYPGDIAQAKEVGQQRVLQHPKSGAKLSRLVTYMEKGRMRGKHVDEYIADSLENATIGANFRIVRALRLANSYAFRPLFTTVNLGFQLFNIQRDFWRFWRNQPEMTLARSMRRYWEAVPLARVRAFGLPDKPSMAQLKAYEDMVQAEGAGILSVTFNDVSKGRDVEDTQIEEVLRQTGVGGLTPLKLGRVRAVMEKIEALGNFIETLPKAAGIYEYKGQGRVDQIPADQRAFIREKIGSPDFLAGGTGKPMFNEVFLFSNAIIQGWRADMAIARDPKTRAGFWWKTAALTLVPKMLQAAALYGLWGAMAGGGGGDDKDDPLKRLMGRVSEYDLTNYIVIPVGEIDGKTVYIRMPTDETSRFIGGLTWKTLRMLAGDQKVLGGLAQIADYSAGQFPTTTPSLSLLGNIKDYVGTGNVYDSFRGQMVLSDDEAAAGGLPALQKFVGWQFQQLGGGIVWKFSAGDFIPKEQSAPEKILNLPVVSNILGRMVRISNYGELERLKAVKGEIESTEAGRRISERKAVNEAVARYQALPEDDKTLMTQRRMGLELGRVLYPDAKDADKRDNIQQKLSMAIVRGSADALTDSLISATTNDQKVRLILEGRRAMPSTKFEAWLRTAVQQKVISPTVYSRVRNELRVASGQ